MGLRMPRVTHNEPSKNPLIDPTSKEKSADRSGGGVAYHTVGKAGSSARGMLSLGLRGDAASLSSGRHEQPGGAALPTTSRQTRQSSATETSRTGARTAVYSDTETSTSVVSRAKLLAPYGTSSKL